MVDERSVQGASPKRDLLQAAREALPFPDPVWPDLPQARHQVQQLLDNAIKPTAEDVVRVVGRENFSRLLPEIRQDLASYDPERRPLKDDHATEIAYGLDGFNMLLRVGERLLAWDVLQFIGMRYLHHTTKEFWENLANEAHSLRQYTNEKFARDMINKKSR